MRTTRLPPTWAVVDTATSDKPHCNSHNKASVDSLNNSRGTNTIESTENDPTASTRLEYVNCVTGERTPQHPGTSYFLAQVESERSNNRRRGEVMILSAPPTDVVSSGLSSTVKIDKHNKSNVNYSSSIFDCSIDSVLPSPTTVRLPQPEHIHACEGSDDVAGIYTGEDTNMNDAHSISRYCRTAVFVE